MKKVLLAYSGGLDTTVALKWLKDRGYEVYAYCANVGQPVNFAGLKKKAYRAGATKVIIDDLKKEFARHYVLPALKVRANYEGNYLLATALSRPLIAEGMVRAARKAGAGFVAHGCTGKGNDQVRIEVSVNLMAPKMEILAPVREWELVSRDDEIAYAVRHNLPVDATRKSPYSIDKNLWGVSIEAGALEDPWHGVPRDAYQITAHPENAPTRPRTITLEFKNGNPVAYNGRAYSLVSLIDRLTRDAGKYGIGRTDMIEDRLVGIKSREIYEAPAARVLYDAHEALESLVLDRETIRFKETISRKYGELIYNGLWHTPLRECLDAFVDRTQRVVTGEVRLRFSRGTAAVSGRRSPHSRYVRELATYGDKDIFDQSLAKGFIELWGLPFSTASAARRKPKGKQS